MKYNCVYKNICGGESCIKCTGTTKAEIKRRLKALDKEDKHNLKPIYTELLKK